ncbi:MAG: ASKHA domain-containing protein [Actinomycetota bacterium]|nr:ASKHA domain-containing protein [Actinomycetota bacterium]
MVSQNKYHIRFLPSNKQIDVPKNYNLRQAILDCGIHIDSSCGGVGTCGRCVVQVKEGKVDAKRTKYLSDEKVNEGFVLSCMARVTGDMVVAIPETRAVKAIIEKGQLVQVSKAYAGVSSQEFETVKPEPWIKNIEVEVEKPSLTFGTSDLYRFKKVVKDKLGIEDIEIPIDVLKKLPWVLRENDWNVMALIETRKNLVIDVDARQKDHQLYGLALDIGTTTLVMYLVDLQSGKILETESEYNPQIRFGEDIINRIVFAGKKGGLKKLKEVVTDSINNLIWRLLLTCQIDPEDIVSLMISGNSTMMHLFYEVSPKYIREEPYVTVANRFSDCRASDIGIKHIKNAFTYCIQGVASYLGGDITSGLLATGMNHRQDLTLFIDLGTNGELVVGNNEWMMGCSCSAGPAFEGGGVKCGIRAIEGAIEKVYIDQEHYGCRVEVIGGGKPRGICGSGLIDVIGEMYLKGVIDRKGKFNQDIGNKYLEQEEGEYRYIIVGREASADGKKIYISEVDIDNLMRAKAAVYAGIKTLLEEVDLSVYDLDKVYIAGGLGKNLNIDNAIVIGMLPDIDINKYFFLGNTSVTGAYISLLSQSRYEQSVSIADALTYVELSVNMKFMDRYVAGLFLPYTDLKDFPTVEQLILSLDNKYKKG